MFAEHLNHVETEMYDADNENFASGTYFSVK
jgi:hypothetical protein